MTLASVLGLPPGTPRAVIGMVHLRALPGSPRWDGDMAALVRAALDDARALAEGGADALLVENHGDVPFTARRVDAATVAGMAVAVAEIRARAAAAGRRQRAQERRALGPRGGRRHRRPLRARERPRGRGGRRPGHHRSPTRTIRCATGGCSAWRSAILADVQAKHGLPLAPMPIEQEARDCYARGLADALVVSGVATGEPTPMADLKRVRGAVPEAPLLVGSGASPETVAELLSVADARHRGHLDQARRPASPTRWTSSASAASSRRPAAPAGDARSPRPRERAG